MITRHFIVVTVTERLKEVRSSLKLHVFDRRDLTALLEERYEKVVELCDYDPLAADKMRIIMTPSKLYKLDLKTQKQIERPALYDWGAFQCRATYGKLTGSVLVHEIGHYFLDLIQHRKEKMPYKMQEIFCQHLDRMVD